MRAVILAVAAAAIATPALSQEGHGHEGHNANAAQHQAISQERAVEIAREQGVATVREVEMNDGRWKVEGRTSEGQEIEVEIDPHSGAVLKRELY